MSLPYEKITPKDIVKAMEDENIQSNVIEYMIRQYGDRRAREALEEIRKGLGISLDEEIENTLNRLTRAIDTLYEITIQGIRV
jgi:hypothetical protein